MLLTHHIQINWQKMTQTRFLESTISLEESKVSVSLGHTSVKQDFNPEWDLLHQASLLFS